MKAYAIIQSTLTPCLQKYIFKEFGKHSISCVGVDGFTQDPISFEIREDGALKGCVVVNIFWGQLHIKYLIVEEAYRNKGIGRYLMEHALEFGRKQGCRLAYVETLNFQAPEFYKKFGFKIDFARHGYDKGITLYYLSKDLKTEHLPDAEAASFSPDHA